MDMIFTCLITFIIYYKQMANWSIKFYINFRFTRVVN